jgi:hypothetical protein
MFFQKILKGISGLSKTEAESMVLSNGISSNLFRKKGHIEIYEIKDELTDANLIHHLNDYDVPLPPGHRWAALGSTYGDVSAFISTTAGAVQRDSYKRTNIIFDPYITALNFATNGFTTNGYLFYGYLMTLGKQSVPLLGFSEEVRELHIYSSFLPFHHEGEITAKIFIPSVNIEKAEYYDGPLALADLNKNLKPTPIDIITNPDYKSPDNFANIRELL